MSYRNSREESYPHRRSNGGSKSGSYGGSWSSSDRRRGGDSSRRGGTSTSGGDWGPSRGRSNYSDGYPSSRSYGRGGSSRDGGSGSRRPFNYPRRGDYAEGSRGGFHRNESNRSTESYRTYDSSERSSMTIAATDVGKIIGRGGCTVKELQSKSGAKIKITNNLNHIDSKVDLFGSSQQRDKAEELINDLLSQSRPSKQQRTYDEDNHSNE